TMIFLGSPSGSGSSSDSSTGIQNLRSNSPMPVPGPASVRNLLSSARSMADPPGFVFVKIGAGMRKRQRKNGSRRVGKAKRAHDLYPSRTNGGHGAMRLCPPYGAAAY